MTALFLFLRWSQRLLNDLREIIIQQNQLLASKDIVAYDAARRTHVSEKLVDESALAVYYTGDALQYQNEKMEGRVSDDELTGISSFGI